MPGAPADQSAWSTFTSRGSVRKFFGRVQPFGPEEPSPPSAMERVAAVYTSMSAPRKL